MKKFFKNLFYKWKRKHDRKVIASKPLPTNTKLKWGMVRCHTEKAQGAVAKWIAPHLTEYMYWEDLYDCIQHEPPNTDRNNGGLKVAYSRLAKSGVTASIESHKNAFNGKAKGYEVLVLEGDLASLLYARKYLRLMNEYFPYHVNRGIKYVERGNRGAANLLAAKKAGMVVALLTEDFFIDNESDYIKPEALAKVYDRLLTNG
jgi:hypothetical protein